MPTRLKRASLTTSTAFNTLASQFVFIALCVEDCPCVRSCSKRECCCLLGHSAGGHGVISPERTVPQQGLTSFRPLVLSVTTSLSQPHAHYVHRTRPLRFLRHLDAPCARHGASRRSARHPYRLISGCDIFGQRIRLVYNADHRRRRRRNLVRREHAADSRGRHRQG